MTVCVGSQVSVAGAAQEVPPDRFTGRQCQVQRARGCTSTWRSQALPVMLLDPSYSTLVPGTGVWDWPLLQQVSSSLWTFPPTPQTSAGCGRWSLADSKAQRTWGGRRAGPRMGDPHGEGWGYAMPGALLPPVASIQQGQLWPSPH